ncbi:hypothetical protein D3C71_1571310 [compost metagenome]
MPSTVEASRWVRWNTSRPDSSVTTSPSFRVSHMPSSISNQDAMRAVGGLGNAGITMDMRAHPDGWPMVVDAVWALQSSPAPSN